MVEKPGTEEVELNVLVVVGLRDGKVKRCGESVGKRQREK